MEKALAILLLMILSFGLSYLLIYYKQYGWVFLVGWLSSMVYQAIRNEK